MVPVGNLNVVIDKEILPRIVADIPGTDRFHSWNFSGFHHDPVSSNWAARVTAKGVFDGLIYYRTIVMNGDTLERGSLNLLKIIDAEVENAVLTMVHEVSQHSEGLLCQQANCEKCYS